MCIASLQCRSKVTTSLRHPRHSAQLLECIPEIQMCSNTILLYGQSKITMEIAPVTLTVIPNPREVSIVRDGDHIDIRDSRRY